MSEKTKKKKQRTIAGRSLRYMVLMGLLMVIGTCIAAGWTLFRRNIELYNDYVCSFSRMTASDVSGDVIEKYVDIAEKLEESGTDEERNKILEKVVDDVEYIKITELLMSRTSYADLRYVDVVLPGEEDQTCIWYAFHVNPDDPSLSGQEEEDLNNIIGPYQHVPYAENEKEVMRSIMEGTWDNSLVLRSDLTGKKQVLGAAFSPVYDSEGRIVAVAGAVIDIGDMVLSIVRMCLNIFVAITTILIICILLFYFLIRRRIIRPIEILKEATSDLVENLESGKPFEVNVHSGDEIETLARSFEEMDVKLKQYLQEYTEITAEREHLKSELDLAGRIQADMLPSGFPAFPDRKEFDLYASMTPARDVGGDFYDFFLVDEDHLALIIADVSGKGIPAALFMMMARIMLQNYTLTGLGPKEVLEKVNNHICKNQEEMFVTVWLGILDIPSGMVTAANAGHEYPMLKKPGSAFELVKDRHGLVLGGMEGILYTEYEMELEPGSTLFVYTDGVAEATNEQNKLFGTDRTLEALNEKADRTPGELLEAVNRHVNLFVGDAPQFDDLTMLCIAYFGESGQTGSDQA